MVLFAAALAACGDDNGNGDATEEATEAVVGTEVVEEAATDVAEETEEPAADETVIDLGDEATPIVAATPAPMGTPALEAPPTADAVASPVMLASPVATPADLADDEPADLEMLTLSGEVVLPGALNESFVMSENGCVGLGDFSTMQAGRQLVVRDGAGAIIGVTTLEATDATDSCRWSFSLDVPESEFYAISVPMVVEQIFAHDDVEMDDGVISVSLR
jgi:hypothetical protein